MYRWFGLRGRVFFHTIMIAAGANFVTEKQILRFESKMQFEKNLKRQQLIEASISSGDFLDYDDSDLPKVNHRGGKKTRTDVSEARLARDDIANRGGKLN